MIRVLSSGLVAVAVLAVSARARAQDELTPAEASVPVDVTHYLAQTASAAVPQALTVASAWGGYDGAAGAPVVSAATVVRLLPRLALTAGVSYGRASAADAGLRPQVGLRAQLFSQASTGFDMSALFLFRQDQFTAEDGLFQGGFALGRVFGATSLVMNLLFASDGEGDDHQGEARLGVLRQVRGRLQLGAEARYMHALASTDPRREMHGTPSSEALLGPLAALTLGSWTMVVEGGVAMREGAVRETGAIAMAGLGTSL